MFTGIIETVGTVKSATRVGGDIRVVVSAPDFVDKDIVLGDSVANNGVCLTVIERKGADLSFDVSVESINYSLIGDWKSGTKVNLELALQATTRLGGHLVSGHVDGVAELVELKQDARSWFMQFKVPTDLKKYIAKKGSITIEGISLTVNDVNDDLFSINVIPHTFEMTNLSTLSSGSRVHIEVDLIARYVERLLSADTSTAEGDSISKSFLGENGFL
jgi:riboflavin synthase